MTENSWDPKAWKDALCRHPATLTLRDFSILEYVFLIATLILSFGFSFGGVDFAKSGIPIQLGESFGGIENLTPKIFPMEMYLVFIGTLTLAFVKKWHLRSWRQPLLLFVTFLLLLGLVRLSFEIRENPLLTIRNSAFLWYLSLPLLLLLLPVRREALSFTVKAHLVVLALFLNFISIFPFFIGEKGTNFWFVEIGICYLVTFLLFTRHKYLAYFGFFVIGINFGSAYFEKFQRTVLLGSILTPILLYVFLRLNLVQNVIYWKRLLVIIPGFLFGMLLYADFNFLKVKEEATNASPLIKAETTKEGVEKFRLHLWLEASEKFLAHPFVGIGFHRQVVEKIYAGGGKYIPNDGSFDTPGSPSISGPHNSYLNALARIGIFGVLLLLAHLYAGYLLVKNGLIYEFFLLLGQMIYAFFNVGLEGPARSFQLLLVLAIALKTEQLFSGKQNAS